MRLGITLANRIEVYIYRRGIVIIKILLEHGNTYILKVGIILYILDSTSRLLLVS